MTAMLLKNQIETLATTFATEVLRAIRSAPLEEILAETGQAPAGRRGRPATTSPAFGGAQTKGRGRGGRLPRRSPEAIAKVIDSIVSELKKAKGGLRSEELQKALGLDKKEIARPIAEALSSKAIRKTGQKRATTYFAK